MASESAGHHMQTHRWLVGFYSGSKFVGKETWQKTSDEWWVFMENIHSEKGGGSNCWCWGARAGCKRRAFASHPTTSSLCLPAHPSAWGPAYLRPMGSFQARAFPFQSDLTVGPNKLCHKTRELRKAEVGWNYFYSSVIQRRSLFYTGENKFQAVLFCFGVFSFYNPQYPAPLLRDQRDMGPWLPLISLPAKGLQSTEE